MRRAAASVQHAPTSLPPISTSSAARWVYRTYVSGVESNHDSVTTLVGDERTGVMDRTVRPRNGRSRNHVPWAEGTATHWKLAVSHGTDLRLSLTARLAAKSSVNTALKSSELVSQAHRHARCVERQQHGFIDSSRMLGSPRPF
jgi:hypothetical protein